MAEALALTMTKVQAGFATITTVDDAKKQTALNNIQLWLEDARFIPYREVIFSFIEHQQWNLLLDCFYQVIPFGTGGRRGKVGVGPNRINPYMINSSVQGHSEFLKQLYPGVQNLSVVIAYDVRKFKDAAGIIPKGVPNPLIGLSSRDLAYTAAGVYAANGIKVYTIRPDDPRFISTPELSFLIRRLNAYGGLNISASHNPSDDNGGKVYNRFGAQDIPPDDERLAAIVAETRQITAVSFDEACARGFVTFILEEDREAYIQTNVALSLRPDARSATIVYTPLHGTGLYTVGNVLPKAGFQVFIEPSHATQDGDFPNVRFRIPNPEVEASMDKAVEYAKKVKADLVLATDPDADRIGMMAPDAAGRWHFYNGNQIAVLIADYCIEQRRSLGTLPPKPIVVKTEVTTDLLARIAQANGIEVIGDLLVGFKYIAEVIHNLELEQPPAQDSFILGAEESHGILVTHAIRDKDAAGAALYLAELASLLKNQGSTMDQHLRRIYRQYGYLGTLLGSTVMTGAVGMAKITAIQNKLRRQPPTLINGSQVVSFIDHHNQQGRFGEFKSATDRSARNVLVFKLANGCRIILRPSGTEPKIKVYFELGTPPLGESAPDSVLNQAIDQVTRELASMYQAFMLFMLKLIDVELPAYALAVSDLVSLDCKIDFAQNFLPTLEQKAQQVVAGTVTQAEVSAWIDTYLASKGYGKDPRGLVAKAFGQFIAGSLAIASEDRCDVLALMAQVFAEHS